LCELRREGREVERATRTASRYSTQVRLHVELKVFEVWFRPPRSRIHLVCCPFFFSNSQVGRPFRRVERDYPRLAASALALYEAQEVGDADASRKLLFLLRAIREHERRLGGTPLPAALDAFAAGTSGSGGAGAAAAAEEEVQVVREGPAAPLEVESIDVERLVIDCLIVGQVCVKPDPEAVEAAAAEAAVEAAEAAAAGGGRRVRVKREG
jgi:hypothetical protein